MTKLEIFSIYINNYTLSKINFLNLKYLQGFAPHPTSFATEGSTVKYCHRRPRTPLLLRPKEVLLSIATGEARLRREAKRLYFNLNLIFYITSKTKLVLFNTNFIFSLFATLTKSAYGVRREKLIYFITNVRNKLIIYIIENLVIYIVS